MKKVFFLFLIVCQTNLLLAQKQPAVLQQFSKKEISFSDASLRENQRSELLQIAIDKQEKSIAKKHKKYTKKLREDLQMLATLIEHSNYALLNEMSENKLFQKLSFEEGTIKAGSKITASFKSETPIDIDELLANYPIISQKHEYKTKNLAARAFVLPLLVLLSCPQVVALSSVVWSGSLILSFLIFVLFCLL